jgi:hypothetical protein
MKKAQDTAGFDYGKSVKKTMAILAKKGELNVELFHEVRRAKEFLDNEDHPFKKDCRSQSWRDYCIETMLPRRQIESWIKSCSLLGRPKHGEQKNSKKRKA